MKLAVLAWSVALHVLHLGPEPVGKGFARLDCYWAGLPGGALSASAWALVRPLGRLRLGGLCLRQAGPFGLLCGVGFGLLLGAVACGVLAVSVRVVWAGGVLWGPVDVRLDRWGVPLVARPGGSALLPFTLSLLASACALHGYLSPCCRLGDYPASTYPSSLRPLTPLAPCVHPPASVPPGLGWLVLSRNRSIITFHAYFQPAL